MQTPTLHGSETRTIRVATFFTMLLSLALSTLIACGGSPTGPDAEPRQRIASVIVRPGVATLGTEQTLQFSADVRDANGRPVAASVSWQATGGDIDNGGVYVAGLQPGEYEVRAISIGEIIGIARIQIEKFRSRDQGDDSSQDDGNDDGNDDGQQDDGNDDGQQDDGNDDGQQDDGNDDGQQDDGNDDGQQDDGGSGGGEQGGDPAPQPAPTPTTLKISPTRATVESGKSVQFSADLRDQDGNAMSDPVTWEAAGGTITSTGFYVAGSNAGDFQVRVRAGGLTASATVTIPAPKVDGVQLSPGQDIQSAVDAHPRGTTFVLKAGVHRGQRIEPKDDMTFVGESGAILDGQNSVDYAFRGNASNVTIKNLVVENYVPGKQMGAIKGGSHSSSDSSRDWLIDDVEVRYNDGGGIRIGHGMTIRNSYVHHNSQIGIVGVGDDVLVEGNEISYNNFEKDFDYGWEAGGTKFVKTRNLVVRNNHVHHNWGPGLWTDIDNIDTLYENNLVEDNADTGIFHEISYRATIRNNTVRRNGYDRVGAWVYGAGILVAHSPDVQVYGNVVENNQNGIMGVQQDRGSGAHGAHDLKNLTVRDNTIVQDARQWAAGVAQDIGDKGVFSRNITFEGNRYTLKGSDSNQFEWDNGQNDKDEWRGFGNDRNGSFTW